MSSKKIDYYIIPAFFAGIILIYFYQFLDPRVIVNASDVLTQQYFWEFFSRNQLHSSPSFATWLPHVNGGTPFGGGLEKLFRPLGFLFYYFCSPNWAMSLDVILHFWLMAFGAYLFLRLLGLSPAVSFLSALFFTLSTEQVSLMNAGHLGKLNTIAWTPLVFWAVERSIVKKRWIDFIIAGTLLSAQLYEGHIQISFYVCIAVAIYFIGRTVPAFLKKELSGKAFARLYQGGVVMVLFFLLLSAFTLAHWLEFKGQSERQSGASYSFATSWSMPPEELGTYLVPQLFGLSRANYYHPDKIETYYWGQMPFTQTNDYLGLLPLLLLLVALFKARNRYVYIFGSMALIFLVLAMGKYTPIYYFFYEYAGFKFFRVPKMNLFLFSFAVAVLAGFGAQRLIDFGREKDRAFLKKLLWGNGFLMFSLAGIYVAGRSNADSLIGKLSTLLMGGGSAYTRNPQLIAQRFNYALDGMLVAAIFLFFLCLLFFLFYKNKISEKLLLGGMFVIFLLDISWINKNFMDTIPAEGTIYTDRNAAIQYFQRNPGTYRILNATDSPATYNVHNKYIMFNLDSATGYEAVGIARYNDILGKMRLDAHLVDLLNIKYIIIGKKDVQGTVGSDLGKYEIVLDKDVKVLRNKKVLPRAFPVHRARVVKDSKLILSWLTNPSFDPGKMVFLEEAVNSPLSQTPRPETESKVQITSYRNEEIKMDVNMADNGFVVLSEKYYPGWNAYLDGMPSKIYQADYTFRAVYVPKGEHQIVVRYEPDSYKNGLYITVITLILLLSMICYCWKKSYFNPGRGTEKA